MTIGAAEISHEAGVADVQIRELERKTTRAGTRRHAESALLDRFSWGIPVCRRDIAAILTEVVALETQGIGSRGRRGILAGLIAPGPLEQKVVIRTMRAPDVAILAILGHDGLRIRRRTVTIGAVHRLYTQTDTRIEWLTPVVRVGAAALGGGAARCPHDRMPATVITVDEINAVTHWIEIARRPQHTDCAGTAANEGARWRGRIGAYVARMIARRLILHGLIGIVGHRVRGRGRSAAE